MTRSTSSTSFVTPVKSDGAVQAPSNSVFGRGAFTLLANTTYYYLVGGQNAPIVDVHFQWGSATILTSITVESSSFSESDVADHSSDAGGWIPQTPPGSYVATAGAGVTVTSGGVVAVAGGAQGGASIQLYNVANRRTRIAVVVGATGGALRASTWGKE